MSLLLLFIFGILVGSFLNVLIDRIPREESFLNGRSYCESCKKKLGFFDLIPLLSFVTLRGKCRYCNSSISVYYPLVELSTGVLFVLSVFFLSVSSIKYQVLSIDYAAETFYYLLIISSLIVIFFTDLKYGIIPDKVLLSAIIITLIFNLKFLIFNQIQIFNYSIFNYLLSGIGAFLFFLALFLITKGKGMGFGDVKYVFFMGILLGFPNIIAGLYIAFLTGAFISLILIVLGKKKIKNTVPFGPFLVIGTLLAYFLGDEAIRLFLPGVF